MILHSALISDNSSLSLLALQSREVTDKMLCCKESWWVWHEDL